MGGLWDTGIYAIVMCVPVYDSSYLADGVSDAYCAKENKIQVKQLRLDNHNCVGSK